MAASMLNLRSPWVSLQLIRDFKTQLVGLPSTHFNHHCSSSSSSAIATTSPPRTTRFLLLTAHSTDHSDNNKDRTRIPHGKKKEVNPNDPVSRLQQALSSLPPPMMRSQPRATLAIGLSILATILLLALRLYAANKSRNNRRPGTVADLVRRGQLKSDRRGISAPLKYDDPFNNPMVKVGKSNSTVEMCGKVYRLAPVTLTSEQQAIHQKRRSRAYHWKRPTVFLKEGDPIPPDVDPDTIRWIPANHPFATTTSDIDEDLVQNNVYQKRGVPYRIQAEHEALQRKLEALQSDQKLNKLVIDPGAAKDFGRPFKPHQRADELVEPNTSNGHPGSKSSKLKDVPISPSGNGSTSEEEEEEMPKT